MAFEAQDSSTYLISGRLGFKTKYVPIIRIIDSKDAKIPEKNITLKFCMSYFKSLILKNTSFRI